MFVALCSRLRIAAWGLDGYTETREEFIAGRQWFDWGRKQAMQLRENKVVAIRFEFPMIWSRITNVHKIERPSDGV